MGGTHSNIDAARAKLDAQIDSDSGWTGPHPEWTAHTLATIVEAGMRDVCTWLDRTHDAINQVAILADKVNHNGLTDPALPTTRERVEQMRLDQQPAVVVRNLIDEAQRATQIAERICRDELASTVRGPVAGSRLLVALTLLQGALDELGPRPTSPIDDE